MQLRELCPSNVDSILACCRLMCLLGLAFFRNHRTDAMTLDDAESWTWLQMLRGVKTVQTTILQSGLHIDPRMAKHMEPAIPSPMNPCGASTPVHSMSCQHLLLGFIAARIWKVSRHCMLYLLITSIVLPKKKPTTFTPPSAFFKTAVTTSALPRSAISSVQSLLGHPRFQKASSIY